MKTIGIVCLLLLGLIPGGVFASLESPTLKQIWETPKELMVPESVFYDADHQVLYVANIAGKPTEKNGQGFIAQVNLDGTIKTLKWVTGLNAPKGMGLYKGTLYVTDIDRLHAIDIASGKIKRTWDVAEAKFLNDIAVDPKGTVYFTDMMTQKVHVLQNDKVELFVSLGQTKLNGLLMHGDALLVGTAEGLFSIHPETKAVTQLIEHAGGIDGLKSLGEGKFIVSDWQGKTQIIEQGKPPVVLLDTTVDKINSADLEFIPEKRWLLIPTFFDNRVVAYQLP